MMAVPTQEDLMLPTLAALAELGDDTSGHAINDWVVSSMGLSRSTLLNSRLSGARFKLKGRKPPLAENRRRGYWFLTSDGRSIFRNKIPSDEDLVAPTLDAISELSRGRSYGAHNDDIHNRVVYVMGLPSYLAKYKSASGKTPLVHSRINSAKTKLRKGRLIESRRRGYWSLVGRQISVDQGFGRERWVVGLTDKSHSSEVRIKTGNRNRVTLEVTVVRPDGTKVTRRAILEIDDMDAVAEAVRWLDSGDRPQLPGRRR